MTGTVYLGKVIYNGFEFPEAIHSSFTSKPVPSTDGRTIKYVRRTIRVETIVTPDDLGSPFVDSFNTLITNTLVKPGQTLYLEAIWLGGDLLHNASDDLEFGPTPQIVFAEPIAGNSAFKLIWECTYTQAHCNAQREVAELTVAFSFDIGQDGMTTRTLTGTAEKVVTRVGSHRASEPVDALRDRLTFQRLPNFQRSTKWDESADKRSVKFAVIDTEIPSDNPYFPYMVRMTVKETLSGGLNQGGLKLWKYRIYGSINVAPSVPRSRAWIVFLTILQTRLSAITNAGTNADGERVSAIAPSFEFDNDIYGRDVGFSVSYVIVCDLNKILSASGLWRPVPGTNWEQWSTSMAQLQGNRGYANLKTTSNDDLIVDFCGGLNSYSEGQYRKPTPAQAETSLSNNCPPEATSWLDFKNSLMIDRESNTIQHYPLGEGDSTIPTESPGLDVFKTGRSSYSSSSPAPYTQERGSSETFITMTGQAVRIGYHIPIPKITKIGNATPIVVSEKIEASHVVGWSGNCPVYAAKWTITYRYYSNIANGQKPTIENVPKQYKK